MKTFAYVVLFITGSILAVGLVTGIVWMVHAVATNGDGAGMSAVTLFFAVLGAFAWSMEKVRK